MSQPSGVGGASLSPESLLTCPAFSTWDFPTRFMEESEQHIQTTSSFCFLRPSTVSQASVSRMLILTAWPGIHPSALRCVCSAVCVYMCVHVCMLICVHVCEWTCVWGSMCMYVCVHVCECACSNFLPDLSFVCH